MRVEFRQGIPNQCFEWLLENIGPGNVYRSVSGRFLLLHTDFKDTDAWFYYSAYNASQPDGEQFVSTITFKDPKMATWVGLRWA